MLGNDTLNVMGDMDGDADDLMARLGITSHAQTHEDALLLPTTDSFDDVHKIQNRFIMAIGTDCCYDRQTQGFIKCSHLKLAAPTAFPLWLKSHDRSSIESEKIVFDPCGKTGGEHINMFTGFSIKPIAGRVEPMLEHLMSLCGEDQAVFNWVVNWIAYPLQYPGAKMKTAVVFHGREGTGKNLFWDAITAIYGRYGVTIGQSQIETEFNAWMSCKLFVLANEVLSRRERRHIKGRLKAMITEPTVLINQKNMPVRTESNHANIVFLSNEIDPVDTDRSDRRYMVVNCDNVYSRDYYKELAASIDLEALYHYFLNVDLGDFGPHTQPLMTAAKTELLKQNMRSEQLFIDEWLEGETLIFPKMSVPSLMLYWAYRCWCAERGEKYPASETRFGRCLTEFGILKSRANVTGRSGGKKIIMAWIDAVRSSVSEFEFDEFQRLVDEEKNRFDL